MSIEVCLLTVPLRFLCRASPALSSRHMSPPSEPAPRASTSGLPPPPSSLPPRPASLPPKPATSYGAPTTVISTATSSSHRRETSATGSTTSNRDRDRDGTDRNRDNRDRERDRERSNQRDTKEKDRDNKRDGKGGRERSISKGKESDRDSNYSAGGTTSITPHNEHHDYDSIKHTSELSSAAARGNSPAAVQPPEPLTRPPEDEPPPPPPLPPQEDISDDAVSKDTNAALSAPIIAVEDATPTPEPDLAMKESEVITKKEAPASRGTTPSTASTQEISASNDKAAPQQGRGRKTLPPSSTAKAGSATPESSPRASTAAAPPSAIPANVAGTPSRPSTPLGRKKLPASVTAAASRLASPAPAHDGTPVSTAGHPVGLEVRPSSSASISAAGGSSATPIAPSQMQEGGKTSAGNADALAAMEAKQKRKEEKRKRKLAALTNGLATPGSSNSSISPKANGGGHALLNGAGSPAIRINGVSPSSLRNDAHPPTKMRRVDSATSIDSNDKGGLKVKLNGITLNRVSRIYLQCIA